VCVCVCVARQTNTESQVRLSGYGVELAIKSTEYKAKDDTVIAGNHCVVWMSAHSCRRLIQTHKLHNIFYVNFAVLFSTVLNYK